MGTGSAINFGFGLKTLILLYKTSGIYYPHAGWKLPAETQKPWTQTDTCINKNSIKCVPQVK